MTNCCSLMSALILAADRSEGSLDAPLHTSCAHHLFRNTIVQLFEHVFRIPRESLGFADCHLIRLCKGVQVEDILGNVRSEAVSAPQQAGLYTANHLGLAGTASTKLILVTASAISNCFWRSTWGASPVLAP